MFKTAINRRLISIGNRDAN